jgi:hypothetical protein
MTPATAKVSVWDHWEDLRRFCQRRFRGNPVVAEEAFNFILNGLAADEWARVRAWHGQGAVLTFLMVMARHLITDFERQKYGHIREPKWLEEKNDPVWHAAYRLLVLQQYAAREAAEILMNDASRERSFVDEVIRTVQARCNRAPAREPASQPIDPDNEALAAAAPTPLEALIEREESGLAAALLRSIDRGDAADLPEDVRDLLARLKPHLQLSAEDCMLLKLHCDGVKMSVIAQLLHLDGDPYKRLKRLLRHVEDACRRAGVR